MSMQKDIIDKIREEGGDFLIELKANQRSLCYGVGDRIKEHAPLYSYTEGPELGHGRIETRTYRICDGLDIIADKEKWGGNMTIIEYESDTVKKPSGAHTSEKRLYVSGLPTNTPALGSIVRKHRAIESMHWGLDLNLLQDKVKRKSVKAARNLDTMQRIVYSLFSIWRGLRKKQSDKRQKKRYGWTYEAHFYELYQILAFFISKLKIIRFGYKDNFLIYNYNKLSGSR